MSKPTTVKIDDVEYVRSDIVAKPITGNRSIIVVDRGWIFAGDVTRENGQIKLTRAIHVYRWESIGFDGMVENPKSNKVTLKQLNNDVLIPITSEIFSIPVSENWGF
jgi:hypothetical protein